MARTENIAVNRFVGRRPQLFFEEAWAERLKVPYPDFGVGMTADEVADLSARINQQYHGSSCTHGGRAAWKIKLDCV